MQRMDVRKSFLMIFPAVDASRAVCLVVLKIYSSCVFRLLSFSPVVPIHHVVVDGGTHSRFFVVMRKTPRSSLSSFGVLAADCDCFCYKSSIHVIDLKPSLPSSLEALQNDLMSPAKNKQKKNTPSPEQSFEFTDPFSP